MPRKDKEKERAYNRKWDREHRPGRPYNVGQSQRTKDKLRDEVFNAYGNQCQCCAEKERFCLTIDHIAGRTETERQAGRLMRGVSTLYVWLRKNNFPPGFRTLCFNCNYARHRNGGICPHEALAKS